MTTHPSTRRSALLGKLATAVAAVAVLAVVGMTPALADNDGGRHGGYERDWHGHGGRDRDWHGREWRGHDWRRDAWRPYHPYVYGHYDPYYVPYGVYIAPY